MRNVQRASFTELADFLDPCASSLEELVVIRGGFSLSQRSNPLPSLALPRLRALRAIVDLGGDMNPSTDEQLLYGLLRAARLSVAQMTVKLWCSGEVDLSRLEQAVGAPAGFQRLTMVLRPGAVLLLPVAWAAVAPTRYFHLDARFLHASIGEALLAELRAARSEWSLTVTAPDGSLVRHSAHGSAAVPGPGAAGSPPGSLWLSVDGQVTSCRTVHGAQEMTLVAMRSQQTRDSAAGRAAAMHATERLAKEVQRVGSLRCLHLVGLPAWSSLGYLGGRLSALESLTVGVCSATYRELYGLLSQHASTLRELSVVRGLLRAENGVSDQFPPGAPLDRVANLCVVVDERYDLKLLTDLVRATEAAQGGRLELWWSGHLDLRPLQRCRGRRIELNLQPDACVSLPLPWELLGQAVEVHLDARHMECCEVANVLDDLHRSDLVQWKLTRRAGGGLTTVDRTALVPVQ